MSQETKRTGLPGRSRQDEEAKLLQTMEVVRANVKNYGADVARMKEDIDEMLEHFHDDNPEVINLLENTITIHDHLKRALERNERALKKPYFGRIDFHDETLKKDECLYIGKGGVARDATSYEVIDWRAPVANTYYENGLGKCSYTAPGGKEMPIELQLKRTYEIEGGKLLDYYDSEVVANDELLTKYLAKNKQAVLGEIVATIQAEQNAIIRRSPLHNIIVQGVAGSGKTTVAMHRISFILYNYPERFKPDDFYIVGSNRILLNYITSVLPDLDVYGVRQMTMEQLFARLLYEDWDENKIRIRPVDRKEPGSTVKGTTNWFQDLKKFVDRLEWNTIPRDAVYLNPRQFVEGFKDGKTGVFDETGGISDPKDLICIVDRDAIERYILQNPTISVQSKIDMLNERLTIKLKEEFMYRGVKYTDKEKKAVLKAFHNHYGPKTWKKSIFTIYREFLELQRKNGHPVTVEENNYDVYDLAALAYLYKRVKETEVISEAHHVVIDEAQDFGMMAYRVLDFCIHGCTYTIMGDVSQNIHFGYGLHDWEELKELLLQSEMSHFGLLKKSYRNTVEISEYATRILKHGQFSIYPAEPIIRHGEQVQEIKVKDRRELIRTAARLCKGWQKKGFETIAVVCRDDESAKQVSQELSSYIDVLESDLEKAVFGNGILVLPVSYTKGLEFDAVLIFDPTREDYPADDGHAKLLYVAGTRALHELCVLSLGDLTGLIADPVPEVQKREGSRDNPGVPRALEVSKAAQDFGSGKSTPLEKAVISASPVRKKNISIVMGRTVENTAADNRPTAEKSAAAENRPVTGSSAAARTAAAAQAGTAAARPRPVLPRKQTADVPGTRSEASYGPAGSIPSYLPQGARNVGVGAGAGTINVKKGIPIGGRDAAESFGIPSKKAQQAQMAADPSQKPAAVIRRKGSGSGFGDLPPTEKLRPMGHAKADLAIRWMEKRPDGLYLQSRYGILRIRPITGSILHISFAKGQTIEEISLPQIAAGRMEKNYSCRENASAIELYAQEVGVLADKRTGALTFLGSDKKPILAERRQEPRLVERNGGQLCAWQYFDWDKKETLYAMGGLKDSGITMRGQSRYISAMGELPFLISDKGYGILVASQKPVICCDISAYGSFLCLENTAQMDYYLFAGKKQNTILSAYGYLLGKL